MTNGKVGVLTFHRCINYGSYWQARCLVEGLRSFGHDAELLDHYSPQVARAELKCSFRPTLPTAVPRSDAPLYRKKIRAFVECIDSLPLSQPFRLEEPATAGEYDVAVVGSDEVWNLFHPWYGKFPVFFGNGLQADRMVSYAASFGSYPWNYGLGEPWTEWLSRFSAISVRDQNSRALLQNTLGIEPEVVLDPCLTFPVRPEERPDPQAAPKYAAVYGHNFSDAFIRRIRRWARQSGTKLISIGYRNNWAHKQWLSADPHDFAHFIDRAAAVITNFFHGCVFSLRYLKPFVCEAGPYRRNKLSGLMAEIDSEERLVGDSTPERDVFAMLNDPLDVCIGQNLDRLRRRSEAYLERALA